MAPGTATQPQVDAFCIPLTIELGEKKLGITESRTKLFQTFRNQRPQAFQASPDRLLDPLSVQGRLRRGWAQRQILRQVRRQVWNQYANGMPTPAANGPAKWSTGL